MRALAALILLVQLQPVLGSVLCLHDTTSARAECAMPHEERPAGAAVGATGAEGVMGCAGLAYCAPTAPAIPRLAVHLQLTPPVHGVPLLKVSHRLSGALSAPPFHPPRG